jgi:U3 small nucleolar RNA-associated protein 19
MMSDGLHCGKYRKRNIRSAVWFLKGFRGLLRKKTSQLDAPLIENILQLLESITMPKSKLDIKSFYISELGKTPKDMPTPAQMDEDDENEDEDDWRAYFDTNPDDKGEQKPISEGRSSQFSTHKALHSLQSHQAHFSTAWLALLQHIKSSQQQSARVLSILHRSIMPHLTQPVQLMDWIGACVDFGT